jgi:hypothetical protein
MSDLARSPDDDAARRRRVERLQDELHDAGFDTRTGHGPLLLSEIDRARFPGRHEGRFPTYGAIVAWDDIDRVVETLDTLGATRLSGHNRSGPLIRRMSGGIHGFALVQPDRVELALLAFTATREIELVKLRRQLGPTTALVSRSAEGIVRVVRDRQIVTFDGTSWWVKPDAREYASVISNSTGLAALDLTEQILDFCVHVAGPGPGGATLVWCLDADADSLLERHSRRTEDPLSPRIPLGLPTAHSALRHLLTHTDGACRVSPEGDVTEVGLHLRASAAADSEVAIIGGQGTRHASAQRCSFDIPTALVFVISDDGPVTVYRSGRTIASIDMLPDPSTRLGA